MLFNRRFTFIYLTAQTGGAILEQSNDATWSSALSESESACSIFPLNPVLRLLIYSWPATYPPFDRCRPRLKWEQADQDFSQRIPRSRKICTSKPFPQNINPNLKINFILKILIRLLSVRIPIKKDWNICWACRAIKMQEVDWHKVRSIIKSNTRLPSTYYFVSTVQIGDEFVPKIWHRIDEFIFLYGW